MEHFGNLYMMARHERPSVVSKGIRYVRLSDKSVYQTSQLLSTVLYLSPSPQTINNDTFNNESSEEYMDNYT